MAVLPKFQDIREEDQSDTAKGKVNRRPAPVGIAISQSMNRNYSGYENSYPVNQSTAHDEPVHFMKLCMKDNNI